VKKENCPGTVLQAKRKQNDEHPAS